MEREFFGGVKIIMMNKKLKWKIILFVLIIIIVCGYCIYHWYSIKCFKNDIIKYLNNKYGDNNFKIVNIEKTYYRDPEAIFGISHHNGYCVTISSPVLQDYFTLGIRDNDELKIHMGLSQLWIHGNTFTEKYYTENINKNLSQKYDLNFCMELDENKIKSRGHIPTFNELIEDDAIHGWCVIRDSINNCDNDVNAQILYLQELSKDLIEYLNIEKDFKYHFHRYKDSNNMDYLMWSYDILIKGKTVEIKNRWSNNKSESNPNFSYTFNVNESGQELNGDDNSTDIGRKKYGIEAHLHNGFTYGTDDSKNATIIAYNGNESNLTIPSTIDDCKVVAIGKNAFNEKYNSTSTNGHTIKNVIISEGIERIESLAFAGCENLETIKLPESLNFIDTNAFLQCSNLKSINIPSKIETIKKGTFQETGLEKIEIPKNVKKLDSRAFALCRNLRQVSIYNDVMNFYSIAPQNELGNGVVVYDVNNDNEPFYNCPKELVLYANEGSTTEKYAQENGIKFEKLYNNN